MEFTVVIRPAEGHGYWAEVPVLPGCHTQGETIEETLANIKEATEVYVSVLLEDGLEAPSDEGALITWVSVET